MSRYVQTLIDLHPSFHVFVGQAQSGKTTAMQHILSQWPGHSLAVDRVCTNPPAAKHLARYTTWWTEDPPDQLPPGCSLVACDEFALFVDELDKWPGLKDAVFRGQHQNQLHGVTALLGTQRPVKMGDTLTQAATVTMFRTIGATDLQRLMTLPGVTREMVDWLPHLAPGWAMVWHRDGARVELPRCILEPTGGRT